MGTTIHELRAIISMNLNGFVTGAQQVIDKTKGMGSEWGRFANDAVRAGNRIVNTMALIGGGVAGAAAKMGFSFNSIKEQSEIAFTTMLGDAGKAKKMIADLTEFAARTPFELPGLLESAKKLMAFGFQAEQILPMLTVVGDAAAGMGNPEAIGYITRALGQIQAKGKVMAQEMNQLAEQGIPAWETLAEKIGVSIPEAMKLAENGAISSSVAIPALLEGMNARFGGMMEKQSQTMSGLWSTMLDRMREWTGTAFEPLYNSIRNGLGKLLSGDSLQMLDDLSRKIQASMGQVAREVDRLFASDPSAMFSALSHVIQKVVEVVVSLVKWIRESGPEFMETGKYIYGFVEALMSYLTAHPQILAMLVALKVTGFLGINSAVISLGKAIFATIGFLATFVTKSAVATAATTADTAATVANTAAHTANAAAKALSGGPRVPVGRMPVSPGNAFGQIRASSVGVMAAEMATGQVAASGFYGFLQRIGGWFAGLPAMAGSALSSVGGWFAKLGTIGTGVTTAGTLAVAGWVAVGVEIVAVTKLTFDLIGAMFQYHAAVKEGKRLNQDLLNVTERKKDKEAERIDALPAAERSQAMEQQMNALREENARKLARKDQLDAEAKTRRSSDWGSSLFGNFAAREAEEESKRLQAEIEANDARMNALREKQTAAQQEPAAPTAPGGSPAAPGSEFAPPAGELADLQSKVSPDAQALQDRTEAADNAISNFGSSLMEWEGIISDDVLNGFEQSFGDLAQQFRDGTISEQEFELQTRAMNEGLSSVVPFMEQLNGLADVLPAETLQGFESQFVSLMQQLQNGELTANQYQMELDLLNQSMDLAAQGVQNAARFEEQLTAFRERLGEAGIEASSAQIAGYQSRFDNLNRQFQSGAISANKFAQATDVLQREMDAAGNAAIKELQAKERARLLAGNFTQEEFQKAAEDRIIQMRMQQFDQYVEQSVNLMMGFNNGLQQVNGGLQNFGGQMQQWGQGFGQNQYQFDPEQLRAAAATYGSFMATTAGQISTLMNNIALANERLSWSSIVYGDSIKGKDRWDLIANIEQWVRQIAELQTSPAPQFVSGLGSFQFNDPGLQTGQGANTQGGGNSFHFNFPNIDAVNSRTAAALADSVEQEMRRRGRRLF